MSRRKTQHRSPPQTGSTELLHGAHTVLEALANRRRDHVRLFASRNAAQRHGEPIARSGVATEITDSRSLDRKAGGDAVHQGLVLETSPLPPTGLDDLDTVRPVIVLDQVSDPHNVGAILRSAAAHDAQALIVTDRHAPRMSGIIAKAASGAVEHVAMVRVTNLARALEALADNGFQRIGLVGSAEATLEELTLLPPVALVLGAEGKGLRALTAQRSDHLVRLDLPGPIKSLNVSNAAAIALNAVSHARP